MIKFAEIWGQREMAAYPIRQMAYDECHFVEGDSTYHFV